MKPVPILNAVLVAAIAVLTVAAAMWLLKSADDSVQTHADYEEQAGHAEDATPRGPHGGRLLSEGPFSLEVTVYELSLIHISEPTRPRLVSRMPSSA